MPNIHPTSILPVQGGRTIPKNYKCGFTLAEVLITLVIIGVIAAITVPTLMNNTNKQEYVSKLKKAYSVLAQATNVIISEEGPPSSWITTQEAMYEIYKKHLNVTKDCGTGQGCFPNGPYKTFRHDNSYTDWNIDTRDTEYKIVLTDGISVSFMGIFANNENCTIYSWGSNNVCAGIRVDINGAKKPNAVGRDLFVFVIKKDGLYPSGCDGQVCNINNTSADAYGYCACKVLREGAINY